MQKITESLKTFRLLLIFLISIVFAISVYLFFIKAPEVIIDKTSQLAGKVSRKMESVFNTSPMVSISSTHIEMSIRPVTQWVVAEKDWITDYTYSHEWMGSTKSIKLKGHYLVKTGFEKDIDLLINLNVRPDTLIMIIGELKPVIISIEQKKVTVAEQGGWWNRVNDLDRNVAYNQIMDETRRTIYQSGLLDETRRLFISQLSAYVKPISDSLSVYLKADQLQ